MSKQNMPIYKWKIFQKYVYLKKSNFFKFLEGHKSNPIFKNQGMLGKTSWPANPTFSLSKILPSASYTTSLCEPTNWVSSLKVVFLNIFWFILVFLVSKCHRLAKSIELGTV